MFTRRSVKSSFALESRRIWNPRDPFSLTVSLGHARGPGAQILAELISRMIQNLPNSRNRKLAKYKRYTVHDLWPVLGLTNQIAGKFRKFPRTFVYALLMERRSCPWDILYSRYSRLLPSLGIDFSSYL